LGKKLLVTWVREIIEKTTAKIDCYLQHVPNTPPATIRANAPAAGKMTAIIPGVDNITVLVGMMGKIVKTP